MRGTVGAVISKSRRGLRNFRSRRLLRSAGNSHASPVPYISVYLDYIDATSCADGTKISHNPQARSSIVPAATLVDDTDAWTAVRESLRHIQDASGGVAGGGHGGTRVPVTIPLGFF